MKRLVKNGKIILDGTDPLYVKEEQALRKLEELENIEEELGVDLVTLFKALKDGIVYKTGYGWETGDYHWNYVDAKYISLGMSYYEPFLLIKLEQEPQCDTLRPEDYGKTWALTKEELE